MATLEYYDIILKPIQTEKALQDIADKRYAFYVHPEANKFQSKTAVERMFEGQQTSGVKVVVATNVDFSSCSNLSNLFFWSNCQKANLSGWKIKSVTDISGLFSSCSLLKEVDVSGWDTSKVQYMMDVFG